MISISRASGLAVLLLALGLGLPARAQTSMQTNLDSLGIDGGQPVKIDADRFEVFDDRKQAIFSGNVILEQGPVRMQTQKLVVTYTGGTDQRQGNIKRLEASGKVIVRSKDQTATGERAVYEVGTRVIRLTGNVVLTQGENVIRGSNLVVDLATGTSKLVSTQSGSGRVQGVFQPGRMQNSGQN
ncbi:MAG: lipopolysaccharide transport periplasmic protein LptA [Rhodobiaceae bacterium]|nr:lipopolysaccharide transport periplasmic protein LptA [Rhodobiaceae bacterium]MCC0062077.1 lipopolysaccharide transport periplasmic protein LptA [Rhodobiaceae bacterium]